MLELVPSQEDVLAQVRLQLPVHGLGTTPRSNITRESLSERTPFSEGEIQDALKHLCVFEESGNLWIPSVANLKEAWNSLLTAATINGVKLDQLWNIADMENQVIEDQMNIEIHRAVVRHLSDSQSNLEARLDATQSTAWVGLVLLASNENPIYKRDFIAQWQDQLPESWRELANIEMLQASVLFRIVLWLIITRISTESP